MVQLTKTTKYLAIKYYKDNEKVTHLSRRRPEKKYKN